jgi:AhpD family alkylhydroperoxidase
MEPQTMLDKTSSDAYRAMLGVEKALSKCGLEKPLLELVKLRVSQINGCAFCLDLHWKDARRAGESEQRLNGVAAWREAPWYTERERAALLLAEALTRVADRPIPEEIHERVSLVFSDQDLVDLIWAIAAINAWNRVSIGTRTVPEFDQATNAAATAQA